MSPTARSLALLRRDGWLAGVVEAWIAQAGVRRDLFGCIDIVAVRMDRPGVLGVQATSATNVAHRLTKARSRPELRAWLLAGNGYEVWGWGKIGDRWHVRRVALTAEDLAGQVELQVGADVCTGVKG